MQRKRSIDLEALRHEVEVLRHRNQRTQKRMLLFGITILGTSAILSVGVLYGLYHLILLMTQN